MLFRPLLLTLATAHAWNDCAFPDVGYFIADEGIGISFAYGAAAVNGKLYTGGYHRGHFALVGVTDSGEVAPEPATTIWGDVHSDIQNLYVAETNEDGKMTKSWRFKSTGMQAGSPGHGPNVAQISPGGMNAMLDKKHLALKGTFQRCTITLPDGTLWSSTKLGDGSPRPNYGAVSIMMKLDIGSTNGVGAGTTGWARMMDCDHNGKQVPEYAGGVSSIYFHGDTDGDMIVSFQGCAYWNATAGEAMDCKYYLAKLAAADGSEVWRHELPHGLTNCQTINDKSIYCGYSMSKGDGAMDFGNGQTVPPADANMGRRDNKAVVVKFNTEGVAQWAKATHAASLSSMSVSEDGRVLAITGGGVVSRIDTSPGKEGEVMWTDNNNGKSVGGHSGYRGIEVISNNGQDEIVVHGSMISTPSVTLTDSTGSALTMRNRGGYEIFVASFDALDGTGKWAMDGGGDGGEYFFAFASDPDTHAVYVGGGVYDAPEYFQWGDVRRTNAMYHPSIRAGTTGSRGTIRSSPLGSTKAFIAQIKSTTSPPACLKSCSVDYGQPQASDVLDGHCYIDRHCYADGDYAPYAGAHCMKCDASKSKMAWSGPDKSSACFIDGKCIDEGTHKQECKRSGYRTVCSDLPCTKCVPSVNATGYTTVADGCLLGLSVFPGGSFYGNGSKMPESMQPSKMQETIDSMTRVSADKDAAIVTLQEEKDALQANKQAAEKKVAAKDATIDSMTRISANKDATIATLQEEKDTLQAGKEAAEKNVAAKDATIEAKEQKIKGLEDESEEKMPDWAIALIVIVGCLFLLTLGGMAILVSREQAGKPIFMPIKPIKNGAAPQTVKIEGAV